MARAIKRSVIAAAFQRLRARRAHPLFAGYLHLQRQAALLQRLSDLRPNFAAFYDELFRVKGHPLSAPYIKPFNEHKGPSQRNLWLNQNVAGTYAPSSLRPGQPFRAVVDVSSKGVYSLKEDHSRLALRHLLYGTQMSVLDLAMFLYRDFELPNGVEAATDLVRQFAVDFGYVESHTSEPTTEFVLLYRDDSSEWRPDIVEDVEVLPGESRHATVLSPLSKIRQLDASDLLDVPPPPRADQPLLRELHISGLLSFRDETVFQFGRLNLLVGPNGAGKSNLIDCIRLLKAAPTDIQRVFSGGGFEEWLNNNLGRESGVARLQAICLLPEANTLVRHELRLGPAVHSRAQLEEVVESSDPGPADNVTYFHGSYRGIARISPRGSGKRRGRDLSDAEYTPTQSILSQIRDSGHYPEITELGNLYASFRIYTEWSFGRGSSLREAAAVGRSDARLSESMNDLPVVLNALERTTAHERIVQLLPELKETYRDYVTRLMFGRVGLELVESSFKIPIPQSRLSDGTLRFLALAAILLQPDPPPLICIEEPELGMHPDMIRIVARMMTEVPSNAQLVVSTHSETLLTALEDDFDVLFAFNAGVDGSSVRRFDRTEFAEWRAENSLGKLWTSGELGGNRW